MGKSLLKFALKPGYYNPWLKEYRHYYHVSVFPDNQAMWEYGRKLSSFEKDQKGGWSAITIPIWREKYKNDRVIKAPKIGDVLFDRDHLSIDVISHEAVHMATSYLRFLERLKLSEQIDEDEERLAYCVCHCTNAICLQLESQGWKLSTRQY